jgi:ABC-type multidrug transport system fused ATPase/permease subunit
MFMLSWQLAMVAFISVPVITILSRIYGNFVRSLTKVMQTKLAEGNSVSEAALSSMPTIRAFDAAPTEYKEFKRFMDEVRSKRKCRYKGECVFQSFVPHYYHYYYYVLLLLPLSIYKCANQY